MRIGDLVRLKNPMESEKDLVGVLTQMDSWRPVGTVYWVGAKAPRWLASPALESYQVYLRDIELIKQAKTKAV